MQGVFYRQASQEKAKALGIQGTVMNCDDDSVAIKATGTKEMLDAFVAWCRQGPPRARVADVIVKEIPLEYFGSFTVEHK